MEVQKGLLSAICGMLHYLGGASGKNAMKLQIILTFYKFIHSLFGKQGLETKPLSLDSQTTLSPPSNISSVDWPEVQHTVILFVSLFH